MGATPIAGRAAPAPNPLCDTSGVETSDHFLSIAAALFAFGTGIGEFYLQSRMVEFRRFGRAVKIAATLGAGLFALESVLDLNSLIKHGAAGVAIFAVVLMVYIVAMMDRLQGRGKLKDPD
jgi:Na+/alanine symporter